MVMIANKRSQMQMIDDLNLFLGDNSKLFCEWLHDLLLKLQEVTEGAFEVRVPLKRKSTETKPVAKDDENEALKISKLSRKPSPIRMASDSDESKKELSQDSMTNERKNSGKRGRLEKHHKHETKHSGSIQSTITMQKRPTLPASKQANPTLLKKAMQAAQVSTTDSGEYNPEIPSTTELPTLSDAETKRRKREQLMQEHKELQRLKSQHEEETTEPMIELQVAEDDKDDLFNTERPTGVKDSRIVMEKSPDRDNKVETGKKEKSKKERKGEKRKVEEAKEESGSGNDGEVNEKERNVKTREKRKKPKFIVTLEGVGSEFEEKYEKEHSKRKKRRKSSQKDEVQPEINRDVPIMPVYPQLIHGVHQVPGMIPAHLNPAMPAPQPVHILPPPPPPPPPGMITAPHVPIPTTIQNVTEDVEYEEPKEEKCRFWPDCKNGDECEYYHPDIACKHFPNCRYGKDCSYTHPPCKFGTRCTSTSCKYSHEETAESEPTETETTLCRYHPFCTRNNCPFLHPVDKPCRYGKNCTRPGCVFKHAVPPSREQLKWVAPVPAKVHVSERKFAVNEANATALPVQ